MYVLCTTAQKQCFDIFLCLHLEYPQPRYHVFQGDNFELSFPMPENGMTTAIPTLPALEYHPDVVQAVCYGPHFAENRWHGQIVALWGFSRWRGFVDIDYCFPTEPSFVHVFQYRRVDLSFETLWENEDLFSGLQLIFKKSLDPKSFVTQSIGVPATLEAMDGTPLCGFFTTMHSVNRAYQPLQDNDAGKVFVSDDSCNRRLADIGNCVVPYHYGEIVSVPEHSIHI
eukprot:gene26478-32002_t